MPEPTRKKPPRNALASDAEVVDGRSLRSQRTRRRLVEAARRIIARRGSLATIPIGQLAQRARVATGSCYNHFASKEQLFDAVVAEAVHEHAAILAELRAGIDDPAVALATGARLTMRVVREDPSWGALAVRTGIYVDELWRSLGTHLEEDVRAGTEAGRFKVSDVPTSVAAIAGASFGVMRGTLAGRLPDHADSLLAEQILYVLGLPTDEAHAIAFSPLPAARTSLRRGSPKTRKLSRGRPNP